jgi:hypothetical protein
MTDIQPAGASRQQSNPVALNSMTLDSLPWCAKIAPTLRYAYFSAEAAKIRGSSIYLAHDGSEVEVTCVGESLIDPGSYKWPDRKSVGPVVAWLRRGQTSHSSFIFF